MAIELKMPALSPTMEKGTLAKWLVAEGDLVKAGFLLAEIETDKATMEFEAVDEGRVTKLLVAEGTDDVAVGSVIALIAGDDETSHNVAASAESDAPASAKEAGSPAPVAPSPPQPSPLTDERPAVRSERVARADRIEVSPLAARIAHAKGIDLSGIAGTGPNGRIVRGDLGLSVPAALVSEHTPSGTAMVSIISPPPKGVPLTTTKLNSMRKTIARRLSESKQTIPHFYLTVRCNLDPLLELRTLLNRSLVDRGVKLSVNDLLIKALAVALEEVPDANVQFGGDVIHRFERVDVSMAVAVDGGLVTPVLRDVASRSLSTIANESKILAVKARDGKLVPEDYEGGTVSLSNLGMFGIDEMFPVINPPQAVILGVAAGIELPWKVDGRIELATVMAATASFDHRVIDGATGAKFMEAFRILVENPMRLMA